MDRSTTMKERETSWAENNFFFKTGFKTSKSVSAERQIRQKMLLKCFVFGRFQPPAIRDGHRDFLFLFDLMASISM